MHKLLFKKHYHKSINTTIIKTFYRKNITIWYLSSLLISITSNFQSHKIKTYNKINEKYCSQFLQRFTSSMVKNIKTSKADTVRFSKHEMRSISVTYSHDIPFSSFPVRHQSLVSAPPDLQIRVMVEWFQGVGDAWLQVSRWSVTYRV